MQKRKTKIIAYIFLSLIGLFLTCYSGVNAANYDENNQAEGRVLFISSYSYAWETVPEQIAGIKSAFSDHVKIDYKFMDTKNVNTEESKELFYQIMKQFIHNVEPYDVIIAGDDDAFNFTLQYKQDLFKDIPIVFEGVNNVNNALEAEKNGIATGVIESLSYKNTLELAQRLRPKANKVVAILDDTVTGQAERKEFYEMKKNFLNLQFDEIDTSICSQKEVIDKVSKLDDSNILLYIMCTEDKDGILYTSSDSVKMISQAADIPTFSIVSTGMGYGVLGGELVSQKDMGYEAAKMASMIMSGEKVENIPVMRKSPKSFYFDEKELKRFGIKQKELPENCIIINRQESFWTHNSELIEIVLWIFIILSILLVIMIYDNIRRRKMNGNLVKMKNNLEQASRYDGMTGLLNRRIFMEELKRKIEAQDTFGLLMMDLDNFKKINDTLGHNNGDIVLKELASRLNRLNDENFQAYRLAGDEFTAIIDSKNPKVVEAYAKEIQFSFDKPYILNKQEYFLHSSIGLAIYPKNGNTESELIASADAAMYKVKNSGKGGIAFFEKMKKPVDRYKQ